MADHADLCVKSKVKDLIKQDEMNCAGDVFVALGAIVATNVQQAVLRAQANGRKTVKGSDILIMPDSADHADLCVKSKVKDLIKQDEMNCAGDVFGALGGIVQWNVQQAVLRAQANGRKTVKGSDIHILS